MVLPAGRQELRVPVVGHVHGRRVPVRVAGVQDRVQGVQEAHRQPALQQRPTDAPVLLARAAARERSAAAQVREAASHHRAVASAPP